MALLHPTGVAIKRIIRHDRVAEDVGEAIRSALSESRPTVISLPLDLQRQDVGHQEPAWEPLPQGSWIPSPDSLDSAVGVIASSRRPVILAGRGAFKSGARDPLLRLAERIGAPVGTTLLNKDFFAGDPCNVGVIGTLASSVAGAVVQEADCLIVFGASLDEHTTASGSLTSDKAVVHCDTDPAAIGRHLSVTAGLVGDAAATANAICDWLDELDHEPSIGRNLDLQAALDRVNRTRQEYAASADHLNMRVFSTLLNDILPREKSFTLDAGRFFRAPVQSLNVPDPSAFLWTASFGSVGLGLATGIGGAVGRPGRPMVVVAGDGGLMMSLSELSTAVRYGLDIILVVLNDGAYGAEYRLLVNHDKDPRFSMFQWPDFARLAEAFGASGIVVTDLKDMPLVEQTISKRQGPVVIDVRCDPADPLGQWPEGAQ